MAHSGSDGGGQASLLPSEMQAQPPAPPWPRFLRPDAASVLPSLILSPLRLVLKSLRHILSPLRSRGGQAAVEMAVVMPVLLAVVGISINLMTYLGDCARFDRVAAEAVRTAAASPGYGDYGTAARVQKVQAAIEASFAGNDHLSFSVAGSESGLGGGGSGGGSAGAGAGGSAGGVGFSLLPHHETFVCKMNYRPWGFGDSFFGVEFSGIPHTRSYVIDPYRPGVLL